MKNTKTKTSTDMWNIITTLCKYMCIVFTSISMSCLCGCKLLDNIEDIGTTATIVGVTTGTVCNLKTMDATSHNAIVELMIKVNNCIPSTNESFVTVWSPIAEEHIKKLVDNKTIDSKQSELILTTFNIICKGLDYLFEVKCPQARQYQTLLDSAVSGFTKGFFSVFKPIEVVSSTKYDIDIDTYNYLISIK